MDTPYSSDEFHSIERFSRKNPKLMIECSHLCFFVCLFVESPIYYWIIYCRSSKSWSSKVIPLPPLCLTVHCSFFEKLCYCHAQCNRTHTLQKVLFLSCQSTPYFPLCFGNQGVFKKCKTCHQCFFYLEKLPLIPFSLC